MQMHEINWDNDPEWVVEQGGFAELLKIQKAGQGAVRRLHRAQVAAHPPEDAAGPRVGHGAVPINVCDHFYRSFAKELIPAAKKHGTAVIGMKSLGGGEGKIVKEGVATAEECIRFSLSQDIAALVSGIDSMEY